MHLAPSDPSSLIRLEPHTATAEELEAARRAWRERGWRMRVADDVEEVLAEIRDLSRISPARMRAYLLHPDERVPLAFLRNRRIEMSFAQEELVDTVLLHRGLCLVEREEALWNPFLESLDMRSASLWRHGRIPDCDYRWAYPLRKPAPAAMTDVQNGIVAKLTSDESGAATHVFAQSRGRLMRSLVARHARIFPEAVMQSVAGSVENLVHALKNENLTEAHRLELRRRVEAHLHAMAENPDHGVGGAYHAPTQARLMVEAGLMGLARAEEMLYAVMSEDSAIEHVGSAPHRARQALAYMVSLMGPDSIRRLWETSRSSAWIAKDIAEQPHAPIDVLREIAAEHRDAETRRALARNPTAIADPAVGNLLLSSQAHGVRTRIVEAGTGPAYRQLMRKQIAEDPVRAMQNLERRAGDEGAMGSLENADLLPAFGSSDPQVRESALRVLGAMPTRRKA